MFDFDPLTEAEERTIKAVVSLMRDYPNVTTTFKVHDEPHYGSAYDQAHGRAFEVRNVGATLTIRGSV